MLYKYFALSLLIPFSLLIGIYVQLAYNGQVLWSKYLETIPENNKEFDFIVVGSGSSGSTVAGRLAQAGHEVLLIEAGGHQNWLQGVPSFVSTFMFGTGWSWNYVIKGDEEEQPVWKGFNKDHNYPRGKVLGGSSITNWMLYMRGHSRDYDEWEALGNKGWSYKDVLPYYKKSENLDGDVEDKEMYHGAEGIMGVRSQPKWHEANVMMDNTFKELGFQFGDVNGKLQNGGFFSQVQTTVKDGWRKGTYKTFVEPFLGDPNFKITVLTFAQATKISLDGDKRATSVTVDRFGTQLQYNAKKEIIISAGAIDSPKLLMLSGIGPKAELAKHNIKLVHELPGVGKDMNDHCMNVQTYCSNNRTGFTASPLTVLNPMNWAYLALQGTGPLAENGLGTNGMIHTPANKDKVRPDMELHTVPFSFNLDFGMLFGWNFVRMPQEKYVELYGEVEEKSCVTLLATINRPKSRGSVKLRSADYKEDPLITLNYLKHPEDLKMMVEGYKFIKGLEKTKNFQEYGLKRLHFPSEICDKFDLNSEEYTECYVKSFTVTVYHPASTCKMGPDSDENAVVDNRLKVKGIKSLRVIDASIMPLIVGANTNAPCIMIGEKGADMIIEDWKVLNDRDSNDKKQKKDEL